MAISSAEYKRNERIRRAASGQVYVQEWVHKDDAAALKKCAARLRKAREKNHGR